MARLLGHKDPENTCLWTFRLSARFCYAQPLEISYLSLQLLPSSCLAHSWRTGNRGWRPKAKNKNEIEISKHSQDKHQLQSRCDTLGYAYAIRQTHIGSTPVRWSNAAALRIVSSHPAPAIDIHCSGHPAPLRGTSALSALISPITTAFGTTATFSCRLQAP